MLSAVLEINLANLCVIPLLDTRASCSLIDIGTLERLTLENCVLPSQRQLIDASGNNMNIGGYIEVNTRNGKIDIRHSMQVFNFKAYRKHVFLLFKSTFVRIVLSWDHNGTLSNCKHGQIISSQSNAVNLFS